MSRQTLYLLAAILTAAGALAAEYLGIWFLAIVLAALTIWLLLVKPPKRNGGDR